MAAAGLSELDIQNQIPLDEEDRVAIQSFRDRNARGRAITSHRPVPLGWFSVFCIIANRMIGSGIFRTPDTVIKETESIIASILFWILGALVTFAGVIVFAEFGLAIPRIWTDGIEQSIPANGGEKNYVEYVYSRPRRLATTVFGAVFIFWGNMASNAILFAYSIHIAATGREAGNAVVRGIALGTATFACFLHIYSRRLGVLLNNGFGFTKVLMLLAMIIIAIISFAGGLGIKTRPDAKTNYIDHVHFVEPPSGSYGYTSSFLAIIFAYGGFNQANYILGNVKQPRRRFKWEVLSTVGTICLLYIALNLCYYGITPYDQLIDPNTSVADSFFSRTLTSSQGRRAAAAFQSFSSLGNIIIQTFTAARVKQEIAKEGILPYSRFFAENRFFTWTPWRHRGEKVESGDATPVGALLLHWAFSMILILATFSLTPINAYRLYVNLYSFTIDAIFGFAVGAGLLYLRIADFFRTKSADKWSSISRENKWLSLGASLLFTVANLYPLIAVWIRPPPGQPQAGKSTMPFFVTGTVGFATLAFGVLYWLGLHAYSALKQEQLIVKRRFFTHEEHGETVVLTEVVEINWRMD